jgi:hypothetical protein
LSVTGVLLSEIVNDPVEIAVPPAIVSLLPLPRKNCPAPEIVPAKLF